MKNFGVGSLTAELERSTGKSWHFALLKLHPKYPNLRAKMGTIDVHYPCSEGITLQATVCVSASYMAAECEPMPSFDQVRNSIITAFNLPGSAIWSIHYFHTVYGVSEDNIPCYG